jgi:signal transduction histidine kinase
MATLVSDLSDVSRIESGRLRLDLRTVSLKEVIDEVTRGQKAQIEAKEQNLLVDVSNNLPSAWGDYTRLVQVLTNLVSNAYKYSPRGCQITITAHQAGSIPGAVSPQAIHVSVADNGFGISTEDQKKIFQKFFRSEDQNIRDVPGTGLGLNITRYLVEMQGGQIWFESEPGTGTTFHFTVPIAA